MKIDKELATFLANANRCRMMLTFKKVRNLEECSAVLGIKIPRRYFPSQSADLKTLNRIIKLYTRWYGRKKNFHLPEAKTKSSAVVPEQRTEIQPENNQDEEFSRPPKSPKQKCELLGFQQKVSGEIWRDFTKGHRGGLIIMKVGFGKTFTYGQFIRDCYESGWIAKNKGFAPYPVVIVTKASIVEQTCRVMEDSFGFKVPEEVLVVNYEALRSSFGEMFIHEETKVINGEPETTYTWRPFLNPVLLVLDEYHCLKNIGSVQSKICQAFNDLPTKEKYVLGSSATPFSRVSSAKVFAVSTHKKWKNLDLEIELTNANWPALAKRVASPADPEEFSKAAIKRLLKEFRGYIYSPKHVIQKHRSQNRVRVIEFETKEDQQQYDLAWENYLKERAKIEGSGVKNEAFLMLVQFLKFRQAAELIKSRAKARMMFEEVNKGFAVISADNFKPSIAKAINYLYQDYGIKRDNISIIWGGDARFAGNGDRIPPEEIHRIMKEAACGQEIDMKVLKKILSQLQVDLMGLADLPKELDLGIQSRKQRQIEIDKFQSGKSQYCFFTFGAGGAGLSLHHCESFLRPRRTFASATYNEMECEQAFGRAHRINSLSDTIQEILVFRGTIEQRVLGRMFSKKGCLDIVMDHTDESNYEDAEQILKMTAEEGEEINENEVESMLNDD